MVSVYGSLAGLSREFVQRKQQTLGEETVSEGIEIDFRRYGYKSQFPIVIPGETEKRATNIVFLNGLRVPLGDAFFILFLRLVLELFRDKRGTVRRASLVNGGFLPADSQFQSVARLRQAFSPALPGLCPEKFIESYGPGTLRLSTHPALVTYDKGKLLSHPNYKIRKLAERLP